MLQQNIAKAAQWIHQAGHAIAFTGSGISVESGIPAFRGAQGLWSKYNPAFLDLHYFYDHPEESWRVIKEIFYDFMKDARPNDAHQALARLEARGLLKAVVTQNIDGLHQQAGSKTVYEYHGTTRNLICIHCEKTFPREKVVLEVLPPRCGQCNGLLKPNFVFFSESIPDAVHRHASYEASQTDLVLVIGTTGEVMPAGFLPFTAKEHGAKIIEVNTEESAYTQKITDLFLRGQAGPVLRELAGAVLKIRDPA